METNILVGIICTVIGAWIGVATFSRNRDKDVRKEASEATEIKVKLDSIDAGVVQIRVDMKANEMRVSDLSERVIRVEESVKQAHKRIDNIRGIDNLREDV